MLDKHLIVKVKAGPNPKQVYVHNVYRFTVITPDLLRVEITKDGVFCDEATQVVWKRDLGQHRFQAEVHNNEVKITTDKATFIFDIQKNKMKSVQIGSEVLNPYRNNLKGTARTLDMTNGKVKYEDGIIGRHGVAVMPDNSLILTDEGVITSRKKTKDFYVFANKTPLKNLENFYGITGRMPMIPRHALGVWWSRYHPYTQQEYIDLMDRFKKEEIKFTISTVDMDWHVVNVRKHFGYKGLEGAYLLLKTGWTGYTWNEKLFPDYKQFLSDLKERGLHVTLNLHPAGGIRCFEKQYEAMAAAVGQDSSEKKAVKFDITNTQFLNAYFSILHRPYEKDGVDFWWIDWQQGKKSKLPGYDPLWACNHYHYLDNAYLGKRPLILSRYAGPGSHRYPVGFSGDTMISWRSLRLQPAFTAQASNIGYTTWSHDICGHMGPIANDELYLRWLQYGVFSPIFRLHSTLDNKLIRSLSKEPWNYPTVYDTAVKFINLRHSLIPYIYTSYYQNYKNCTPICAPMYYNYPNEEMAYKVKNQYYFGSELIVCPITSKSNQAKISKTKVWVPAGETYYDIFTGEVLEEGYHTIYRDFESIPVFARAGAIIPMSITEYNEWDSPKKMRILVYPGNGEFELYEDASIDEGYKDNQCAKTVLEVSESKKTLVFQIHSPKGDLSLIPSERDYYIHIENLDKYEILEVIVNKKKETPILENGEIILKNVNISGAKITLRMI